jgi:hypothetical protein
MIDPKELKPQTVILFYELKDAPPGFTSTLMRKSKHPFRGTVLEITPYGFVRIFDADKNTKYYYDPKLIEVVEILEEPKR